MLTQFLIGLTIALVYFAFTWALCVKIRNYGFLDVAWSYGVAILAPIYAINGPGDPARKWLTALIGIAWSLRLGTHILIRVSRHHPHEDPRYHTLRERWPGPGMFLAFFELQAVIAVIFSLPFLFIAFNQESSWKAVEIVGLALAFLALCGEATADAQMTRFQKDPSNQGKVCQIGLWAWSRHPNYFFESLVWWGFFITALGSPWGWVTAICPLLMLYFLLRVTGIPLTEKHSLKSRGSAYREYQRTTSAFIPWFRKA